MGGKWARRWLLLTGGNGEACQTKTVLAVLTVAALVFLPGALVLLVLRVPWQWAVTLAPGISLLLSESWATLGFLAGFPFEWRTAALGYLALLVSVTLVRWQWVGWDRKYRETSPTEQVSGLTTATATATETDPSVASWRGPLSALPWASYAGIVAGFTLLAVPLLVGMGSLTALLQQWDAVFHLSAVRAIRDNQIASSLWGLAPLYQNGPTPRFYPSTFAGLVSLAPGEGVVVLNAAIYVFGVAVWGLGMAVLAAVIETRLAGILGLQRGSLTGWILPVSAAFVTVPAVLFPLLSALPYAAAVVLLPAILAGVIQPSWSVRAAAATAALGMIVTHPIALPCLVLLTAPCLLTWGWQKLPRLRYAPRRLRLRVALLVAVTSGLGLAYWQVSAGVRGYRRSGGANPFGEFGAGLIDLTSLWRVSDWYLGGVALAIASLAGLVILLRNVPRWVGLGVTLTVTAALLVRSVARVDLPWLQALASPWYSQAARIAPVITLLLALLTALALAVYLTAATPAKVLAVALGFTLVTGGFRTVPRSELVSAAYRPGHIAYGTMVDPDDLAVLNWLKTHGLPGPGAIIGDPYNGAAFAYGYAGVDSKVRQLEIGTLPEQIRSALREMSLRPRALCRELSQVGVRYLYLDSDTGAAGAKISFGAPGMYGVHTKDWQLVTRKGSVSVWKLPENCWED